MDTIHSQNDSEHKQYSVIGVMSGTSLDGIDVTYTTFKKEAHWFFEIHNAETISYPTDWKDRLGSLTQFDSSTLSEVDVAYTLLLAEVVLDFIEKNNLPHIDAVCSHGHTALHQPEKGITYQIGNRPELASIVGLPLVCDFRKQDVGLGGQGAPLVPAGDQWLFPQYDVCLNLGGFANLTLNDNHQFIAYDVGGFNLVFNRLAHYFGKDYDDKGAIARSGKMLPDLFAALQQLPFYSQTGPKSLGLEWLEVEVYPLLNNAIDKNDAIEDIMYTYCEHLTDQLARALTNRKNVLCTGGGAYNQYALDRLQKKTTAQLHIPSKEIIEFKESLVFGFLGVLKLLDQPNCFSSITGAERDHSSGMVYFP